jgi:hypothetical protein
MITPMVEMMMLRRLTIQNSREKAQKTRKMAVGRGSRKIKV